MGMIHVEGAGVLGSLLMASLFDRGIEFTWNDTNEKINAWEACTGIIYPSGHEEDMAGYSGWLDWLAAEIVPTTVLQPADYWFNHKSPPHEGDYEIAAEYRNALRKGSIPSLHFNAQAFVEETRSRFEDNFREAPKADQQLVVAHGFSRRLTHYYWGWTVFVKLGIPAELLELCEYEPAFYLKKGRFVFCYAYPIPGGADGWYYAGTSLIHQPKAKKLEIEPKFEKWKGWLDQLSGGILSVEQEGPARQGWRPAQESNTLEVLDVDGTLMVPSLWNNGVRHAPLIIDQIMKKVKR